MVDLLHWLKRKPPPSPREFLATEQAKYPFTAVGALEDSAALHYQELAPRLPHELRQQFDSGRIAIGEIGVLTPNAFIKDLGPAGYVIQVHTGLSRFLYRVSKALHTNVRIYSDGDVQEPTLDQTQTAALVEVIFRNFMASGKIAGPTGYPISRAQIERASSLTTQAELFTVAHEIGHAAIWLKDGDAPHDLSPQQELEADRLALLFALGVAGTADKAKMSYRMIYAGAEFMLRVFAGLEHLGYRFAETHPLPSNRIACLRETMTMLAGGRRGFIQLSTIAFAYDQLLEDIERRLAGPGRAQFVLGLTPERMLSTFSVLLEQYRKGALSLEFVLIEIDNLLVTAPKSMVEAMVRDAVAMYFAEPLINPTAEDKAISERERALLREIGGRLPRQWSEMFADELASTPTTTWSVVTTPS